MAFVPVNNVVMAEMRMRLDNQLIENTLYFAMFGGFGPAEMTSLGNDLIAWWTSGYAYNMSNSLTLREVYLTDLTTQTSPTATVSASGVVAGQNPSPALPNNVALTISFRTAGRGRSSRGRNYICGLPEAGVTGNVVEPSYVAQLVSAYQSLLTPTNVAGFTWVVVSRYSGGAPRTAGQSYDVTAVVATDSTVDSQRRRLPGRGS